MGRILLIEPHKILRQAISLSLFPEHEVHAEAGLTPSASGSLEEYDLLIVDGAALRERNEWTPEIARALQACKTPTLWLEDDDSSQPPKREKLRVVRKPVERDAFQSAVAEFLSPETFSKKQGRQPEVAEERKKGEEPEQTTFQFIDLVDVVEEQSRPRQSRKAARKPK